MPFPFVKPLEGWLVDKLKEREADRNYITTLSPFAIMSSGAIVLKGKKSESQILIDEESEDEKNLPPSTSIDKKGDSKNAIQEKKKAPSNKDPQFDDDEE